MTGVAAFALGLVVGAALVALVALVVRATRRRPPALEATPPVLAPVVHEPATSDAPDRLERALDAIPMGIVLTDARGEIVYRNASTATAAGTRHGAALVDDAVRTSIGGALAGRTERHPLVLFGPPRRTLSIVASPLMTNREVSGVIVLIEDLTERMRLDAVRTDFVANVSHELKTPVGAIALLAETLEGEGDLAVIERLAHRLQTEAERLARIIDELLELSRIEVAGPDQTHPLDAIVLVGEALDRFRAAAEHQGIAFRMHCTDDHLTVNGDRTQLVSAIANLLDNAIKYSEPGSTVDVALARSTDDDEEWIDIVVADHGIGIPPNDLERIFERFYRVDRARSRGTGGTGLGLAIVRHVAQNHGGRVEVTSTEGEGSTFTLRIPLMPAKEVDK